MNLQITKPGRSWSRRKQARPGEILDAALDVFAEKGFAAARMEDIARRAGVTKGTIYLYFPSKQDVFKALARHHVGSTLADAMEQTKDFQGSVHEFFETMFAVMAAKLEQDHIAIFPKIIIAESGNFPELARFWRTEVIDKVIGMATGIIAKGIARGEIRDVPPEFVARSCMSAVLMCLIWRAVFANTDKEAFDFKKFLALHLDILMRGLAPEGKSP